MKYLNVGRLLPIRVCIVVVICLLSIFFLANNLYAMSLWDNRPRSLNDGIPALETRLDNLQKIACATSRYTVTNPNSELVTTVHVFYDNDEVVQSTENFTIDANDQITVDLSLVGVSDGYQGYVIVVSDGPIEAELITPTVQLNADFSFNLLQQFAPAPVKFTNQSCGDYDSVHWDFGDGYTSTLDSPTHIYQEPGAYVTTLTIRDGTEEDQYSQLIEIDYRALLPHISR